MNTVLSPQSVKVPFRLGYHLGADQSFDQLLFDQAIAEGVRYVDVTHRDVAEAVGKLSPSLKEELFLTVQIGWSPDRERWLSKEECDAVLSGLLKTLGVKQLDAVLFDHPPIDVALGKTNHFEWLEAWKQAKKAHLIGVRVKNYADLKTWLEKRKVDVIQLKFHVFDQSCAPLFVFIKAKKQLLIVESPTDDGWLTGDHPDSVHFGAALQSTRPTMPERKAIYLNKLKTLLKSDDITAHLISFVWSHDTVGVVLPDLSKKPQLSEALLASQTGFNFKQKNDMADFYNSNIKNQPLT